MGCGHRPWPFVSGWCFTRSLTPAAGRSCSVLSVWCESGVDPRGHPGLCPRRDGGGVDCHFTCFLWDLEGSPAGKWLWLMARNLPLSREHCHSGAQGSGSGAAALVLCPPWVTARPLPAESPAHIICSPGPLSSQTSKGPRTQATGEEHPSLAAR